MWTMKLPTPQRGHHRWGFADFFDNRHKLLFLKIAQLKQSDVLYDLGCGDASLLIYATKKRKLNHVIGFENMQNRVRTAKRKIRDANLQDIIEIKDDLYDADLSNADVILDMLPESNEDFKKIYANKLRVGTRVIKHNIPLIGYLPDDVVFPFYLMKFPFRKAKTKDQWAKEIMQDDTVTILDLWHELYYYQYEKGYSKKEIEDFDSLLGKRLKR
jgi:predicted RNA methylase